MAPNPARDREPVEPARADGKQAILAPAESEVRYRWLFETAQDVILIIDGDTGKIIESHPFLSGLLGYAPGELLGKELWEIGLFQDIDANRAAFRQLQEKGYIRYEDLPLQTKDSRRACVEFVSNVYPVEGHPVIQCNIRDISDRKRAEEALREADRRKDAFLAMLGHELRNPVTPIRYAAAARRNVAGHRHAGDGRSGSGAPLVPGSRPEAGAAGSPDGLWPGGGSAAVRGSRVQRPPGQASGPGRYQKSTRSPDVHLMQGNRR